MKGIILLQIAILSFFALKAQTDTTIYFSVYDNVTTKENATRYVVVEKKNDRIYFSTEFKRQGDEWLKESFRIKKENDSTLIIISQLTKKSTIQYFHKVDAGFLITEIGYQELYPKKGKSNLLYPIILNYKQSGFSKLLYPQIKDGVWIKYNSISNNKISEENYLNNELITNKNWDEDGKEYFSDLGLKSDVDAGYENLSITEIGNLLSEKANYPVDLILQGISGTVVFQWIIMEDGSINGIKIIKSSGNKTINDEAFNVLRRLTGKWKPAVKRGKPIRTVVVKSLRFTLKWHT